MKDINGYIEKLDKSMTKKEKLFFLNKVKLSSYDYIVDFGCANGRLLYEVDKHLNGKAKNLQLIGVEKNEQMTIDYKFTHQFTRVQQLDDLPLQEMKRKRVLLLLSSVLHEVDYMTRLDLANFISRYVTTVVIRDMYLYLNDKKAVKEERKCLDFKNYTSYLLNKEQKSMFNYIYKSHDPIVSLYEFFLKYTYIDNWETEKQEEYFCNNTLCFFQGITHPFELKYCKHYILPYKKKQVLKDFGYKMRATTHVKLICERRKIK